MINLEHFSTELQRLIRELVACESHFFALQFENSDTPLGNLKFSSYLGVFDSQKNCAKELAPKGLYIIDF